MGLTVFAGLLGLAFGSFMNVCLSRWPEGESVVKPRSHCRDCERSLSWWENVPLLSWVVLRGRCRGCGTRIGWRYPLVELAVGALWASVGWRFTAWSFDPDRPTSFWIYLGISSVGLMLFYWLMVALAVLDAEHLWLPDWLTLPGAALGLAFAVLNPIWQVSLDLAGRPYTYSAEYFRYGLWKTALFSLLGVLAASGVVMLIRWVYWLVRRREGIGLGDAKLMALLAAWLGLPGALVAFGFGTVIGAVVALGLLVVVRDEAKTASWATTALPMGTFLCIGGIVSAIWGPEIVTAYLRWARF